MYNITLIPSMHHEFGNFNRFNLLNILEKIKPDIIFEETDEPRTKDYDLGGTGHTLETFAVVTYMKQNPVIQVPVDTFDTPEMEIETLLDKIHIIENEVITSLDNTYFTNLYKLWQEITNNREMEMVKNIYNYSKTHQYNNAVFICGAEHKKSLIQKINDFESKAETKLNWNFDIKV